MSEFGLWQYPNQVVDVPSNRITMKGIDYPVLGVSDTGDRKVMLPNAEYLFDGNVVREFPLQYQYGGALQDSSFTNYSNPLFFQARRAGIPYLEQKPIDMNDIRNRSLYMETSGNPTAVSPAGAKGLFQIMPITHQDYINRTGDNGDLFDPAYNEKVRDFTFDRIYNHPYIKADYPTDSVRVARTLAAYNMGPGAFNKAMEKAKAAGVDTVNGWRWVDYLPKESREYVNFGLRGMDQTGKRTNEKYQKFLASGNPYIKQFGGLLKPFSYYDIPVVRYGKGGNLFQGENSYMKQKYGNATPNEISLYNSVDPTIAILPIGRGGLMQAI